MKFLQEEKKHLRNDSLVHISHVHRVVIFKPLPLTIYNRISAASQLTKRQFYTKI